MRQLFRLKGVTYEGRQRIIERLSIYDEIYIERDYYNSFDENAIGVFNSYGESIGWIPREIAEWLAPRLDNEEEFDVKINRILGGNGFSYGVEIKLISPIEYEQEEDNAEWRRRQEAVLAILNRPQSEEEKEAAEKAFNDHWRKSIERQMIEGDLERLTTQIQNHWMTLEKIQSFVEYCFNTGRFEDCFKALLTLKALSEYYEVKKMNDFCNENINMFLTFGYNRSLPEPNMEDYPQSIENADESYPELNKIYKIPIGELIDILDQEIESTNFEVKAAALFSLGEIYFLQDKYKEAIEYYTRAIHENPNKALYWGYTAQVLNKNDAPPFISTRYLMKAIELDPNNPRWHFLQAILLIKISSEEESKELVAQAVYEANHALELCRPEQEGLRKAIRMLMGK
ncbi:HIRAN domain-containing protein [Neobacillus drentensis]|uniref:HIRAN domain-containing protein n=1 Tax=Neobacillus drentensis TaxID=220684 RepID=UPI002FFF0312